MSTFVHPPKIDAQGNHWEQHGATLYHVPASATGQSLCPASLAVISYASGTRNGVVLVEAVKSPFSMGLVLTPEDAERMSEDLRVAAARAREVQALKAQRAAKAGRP